MSPADPSTVAPYYLFCEDRRGRVAFWAFSGLDRPAVFVLPEADWNEWMNDHDFAFRNTLFQAGYSSRGCWRRPSTGMIRALREGCHLIHPREIDLARDGNGTPEIRVRSTLNGPLADGL